MSFLLLQLMAERSPVGHLPEFAGISREISKVFFLKGNFGVRFLLGQPASPISRDFPCNVARKPAVSGLLASCGESLCPEFDNSLGQRAENLHAFLALFPFFGEIG